MMGGSTFTQQNEGCNLTARLDRGGNYAIGWGHNSPLIRAGEVWTQDQADAQFASDYASAVTHAQTALRSTSWASLDPVRRAALVDMAYELGLGGLEGFPRMLAAVRAQSWQSAHDQCLASRYAQQVPLRAARVAGMLLTGQWPS